MKKILVAALLAASCSAAFGQSMINRGEVSPGVYENIKSLTQSMSVGSNATYTPASVGVLITTTAVVAANPLRKFLSVQNQDATNPIWVRCDGAAATADGTGVKIAAGQTWSPLVPPVGACAGISTGGTVVTNVIQGQ